MMKLCKLQEKDITTVQEMQLYSSFKLVKEMRLHLIDFKSQS